jgi:hypothetical protein
VISFSTMSEPQESVRKPQPVQGDENPVSSVATTSSSEKDTPSKSPNTSDVEKIVPKKAEEDGENEKSGSETDYTSKAERKTEFKHFLV